MALDLPTILPRSAYNRGAVTPLFYDYFDSPIGMLQIAASQSHLAQVSFATNACKGPCTDNEIICETQSQLTRYFKHKLKTFSLPLSIAGTEFEQKVLRSLLKLPFGSTSTYKGLATTIGHPNAYRAVGNALGKNPIAIIIPCHRVISLSSLGGFTGGVHIKRWLLLHEGANY